MFYFPFAQYLDNSDIFRDILVQRGFQRFSKCLVVNAFDRNDFEWKYILISLTGIQMSPPLIRLMYRFRKRDACHKERDTCPCHAVSVALWEMLLNITDEGFSVSISMQ